LQKCGNHWCKIGTTQVVNSSLVNSTSDNVVSLVETYKYSNCSSIITQQSGTTKISGSCSIAGNGLMYDNCIRRGKYPHTYCSSKGMRVPSLNETRAKTTLGVPSCSGWTWTSTVKSGSNYYIWSGTTIIDDDYNNGSSRNNVWNRCVK